MNAQTETQDAEVSTDGPLLDLTDAGVKKFIKQAKARGYVTMDELNKVNLERNAYYYSQYYGEYYRSYYTEKPGKEGSEPGLRVVGGGGTRPRSRSGRRG